jgi:hypothetical protein
LKHALLVRSFRRTKLKRKGKSCLCWIQHDATAGLQTVPMSSISPWKG